MTQLSEHFTLEELTESDTALRKGITNVPNRSQRYNLTLLASTLEKIRYYLGGKPISISSGFRNNKLNAAIGGSKTSAHMYGLAADFTCKAFGSPYEISKLLAEKMISGELELDQLIYEGTWVHIAIPNPGVESRNSILTAKFNTRGVSYIKGISK